MAEQDALMILGDRSAGDLFLQPTDAHDRDLLEAEAAFLAELSGRTDWCLASFPVGNWNRDLTPWAAEPVFGKEGFGDGAAATLGTLTQTVLPALRREGRRVFLCGYSLAGLFSLWAACQTDAFHGVAAVSPSVWYPGWIDYANTHEVKAGKVYLSLGDREEKTRNRTMAAVGGAIREQHQLLEEAGVATQLDWNPGNHFVDSERRLARGMAWLLSGKA